GSIGCRILTGSRRVTDVPIHPASRVCTPTRSFCALRRSDAGRLPLWAVLSLTARGITATGCAVPTAIGMRSHARRLLNSDPRTGMALVRPMGAVNPATTPGLLYLLAPSPPCRRPLTATAVLLFVFAVAVAG